MTLEHFNHRGIEFGHRRRSDRIGNPQKETDIKVLATVDALLKVAKKDALERLVEITPEKIDIINATLERSFRPYVAENETIAQQLDTPEYKAFTKEISTFLGAKVGFVVCSDGRILFLALSDPRVASVNRRPQGMLETRKSSGKNREYVLDDPDLGSSTKTIIQESKSDLNPTPELVEFVGTHIHSQDYENGCGAFKAKIKLEGQQPEVAMQQGGIPEYFEELGEGFFAFNNVAKNAGGKGTTFDLTHDAWTQGFIVGLRDQYKNFRKDLALKENLDGLSQEGKILRTTDLDEAFRKNIIDEALVEGIDKIDINDFTKFGENAMIIGKISLKLAKQEQENGFKFIPEVIRAGKSPTALRALAYHAIRNVVYRILGNIQPGAHDLLEHPEELTRLGPIGAEFNTVHIPLVQNTPRGRLTKKDVDGAITLFNLSSDFLKNQGIDMKKEGRIMLVTGEFDPTLYADDKARRKAYNDVESVVKNNASWMREKLAKGVEAGTAIIIGCIYDPTTRKLTNILAS